MRKIILSIVLILMANTAVFAQADNDYAKVLTKMFEVSGSEETYKATITQMFGMLKQEYAQVEAKVWNEFEQEFLETSLDDLVEMLIPVYSKHMTQKDLEAIVAFYQTPAGIKFAQKTPLIMQESMQVGQEWGRKIGQEFDKKMKERGY